MLGGSGIGALLAETLADRHVAVAILTKGLPKQPFSNSKLSRLASTLRVALMAITGHIHVFECDVSDYKAVMRVSARVRETVGALYYALHSRVLSAFTGW